MLVDYEQIIVQFCDDKTQVKLTQNFHMLEHIFTNIFG